MIKDILDRLMLARRPHLPLILCTGYCRDMSNYKALKPCAGNFLIIPPFVRLLAVLISIIPDPEKNKSALTKGDEML
jgi:hypothetical protein